MPELTLGTRLALALKGRGVDTIFGIPGVHNVELYRGIEQNGVTHILARHEQGAGFMADGYARACGKPGVAFIISGPGLTNIMTPMGQAYSDSVPMLVISSCLPQGPAMPGRLHQMRDQTGAGDAVCDWSICAPDSQAAFDLLDRAFWEFANQRSRPKHITLPVDVLSEIGEIPDVPDIEAVMAAPDPAKMTSLIEMLDQSSKPLFIFGGGAVHAKESARAVIKNSGAALFTTYAGRGVVGASYPLNFGATLSRAESAGVVAKADLVIAIGTELAEVDLLRNHLGHRETLVRVDIDRDVLDDIHSADLKIQADAKLFLDALSEKLKPVGSKWQAAKVAATRTAFRVGADSEYPGIIPYIDALHRALPSNSMIYSDMTQFAYVAKEIYPMQEPSQWHHPYGFGTLGYGLPAAIGGKIALPLRPVVAIAGDYGFQYTMQELGVAAELSLTLPIILWDNGKLKEIEDAMVRSQIAPNAVEAQNPDFGLLAQAYGIGYVKPESPDEFQTAVQSALNANGPTLIHACPV